MDPISNVSGFKEPTSIEVKTSKIKEIYFKTMFLFLTDNFNAPARVFKARALHEKENREMGKHYAFAREKIIGPSRNLAQVEVIRTHKDYQASLELLKDCQNLPEATKAKVRGLNEIDPQFALTD